MAENRCICCGEIIPEGMMVCPKCQLSQKEEHCNWCEPSNERCGTCARFFLSDCSAMYDDEQCVCYSPIDHCPKCGRKLVTEDGK